MEIIFSLLKAFIIGGTICSIGQILLNKTDLPPAKILVSFVVVGVFLGTLGIYDSLVEFAGAGASVPLTGFGFLLNEGVKTAVKKYGLIGILKGGLTASSVGLSFVMACGLVTALIFKPKKK